MERVEPGKFDGEPYDYGGFRWGEESGLGWWIREHPEEVWEMERAAARQESRIAEQKRHTRNRILRFLVAHPTPWRLVYLTGQPVSDELRASLLTGEYDEVRQVKGEPSRDMIVDADGNLVAETWDGESYASGLQGDVRGLMDMVNLVGEDYEPPCGWHTAYDPTEVEDWPDL